MEQLTAFFMWCTIINGSLLMIWSVLATGVPEVLYRIQSKWFPMPRETFTVVFYMFIGMFKMLVIVFNAVPFLALLIIR
jgi:hypothetical protein